MYCHCIFVIMSAKLCSKTIACKKKTKQKAKMLSKKFRWLTPIRTKLRWFFLSRIKIQQSCASNYSLNAVPVPTCDFCKHRYIYIYRYIYCCESGLIYSGCFEVAKIPIRYSVKKNNQPTGNLFKGTTKFLAKKSKIFNY